MKRILFAIGFIMAIPVGIVVMISGMIKSLLRK